MKVLSVLLVALMVIPMAGYFIYTYYPELLGMQPPRRTLPQRIELTDEQLEREVLATPAEAEDSLEELAAYLHKIAQTERQRAWAIFRWITANISYDTQALFSDASADQEPIAALRSRRAVCAGYTALFEALAKLVGLQTVAINGYSKGFGYVVGQGFEEMNHAWNAAQIDGKWRLLDATWGAGYLDEQGRFVRRFNSHYFDTPPEQFIYDHFPQDPQWQLLETPVTLAQYEQLPFLKPAFFQHELALTHQARGALPADPRLSLSLSAPADVLLSAQLMQGEKDLAPSLTFAQRRGGEYRIEAECPQPGTYTLRVFAKRRADPGAYAWALDYQAQAVHGNAALQGFPTTYAAFQERGAYLYEPRNGALPGGRSHAFKLRVPEAEQVAVVMGEQWVELRKQGEDFAGDVLIQPGEVGVYARFPGDEQYSGMLQYRGL